jgi:hypothetical protein
MNYTPENGNYSIARSFLKLQNPPKNQKLSQKGAKTFAADWKKSYICLRIYDLYCQECKFWIINNVMVVLNNLHPFAQKLMKDIHSHKKLI